MRTSTWRVRVGRGDGGEPRWFVEGKRGQCIAESKSEQLAEVLASLPDLARELEHRIAQLEQVWEVAASLRAKPRTVLGRIRLILDDWAARGFESPGLDRMRGRGCGDDRAAEGGPGGPRLRTYPPWLPQSGVSSSAVLLWAELHDLEEIGASREIRLEDLAERIPKVRGAPRSVRTVQRLIGELVLVGALTVTPEPGKASDYTTHVTPRVEVLTLDETVAPLPVEAIARARRFRRRPAV